MGGATSCLSGRSSSTLDLPDPRALTHSRNKAQWPARCCKEDDGGNRLPHPGRIQINKNLHQRMLGDEVTAGQEAIRAVHKDLINTTTAIRYNLHFMRDLKTKAYQAVQDTIVATRLVEGFRNPYANAAYLKDHVGFPLQFFTRVTVQMRAQLACCKGTFPLLRVHSTDWGSSVANSLYSSFNTTVRAAHFAFLPFFPPAAQDIAENITLSDIQKVTEQLNIDWNTTGNGYDIEQTTKPNDIGLALYDSPQAAGQLVWIGGKFKLCEYPFSKFARSSRLNRV
ncbi:hypothetical protein DFH08DRAFT_997267 [Mycena albidolilacea]|uniref:Uncharacterized protein n=1 Tax=Mycena albidolilacea TaxID=1033008 RepID=A0AAD7A5D3_9AGAR|nr:hypothetical protein DFH08DRAFT_997267 [Mycena albidolilacea]